MPCWALPSTSLMSREFFAVMSSSSPILLLIGVIWFWTYFLVAQPKLANRLAAASDTTSMVLLIDLHPFQQESCSLIQHEGCQMPNQKPKEAAALFSISCRIAEL